MFSMTDDELKLFEPGAIDAETTAFNKKIEKQLSSIRPLYTHAPQVIRDARDAGLSVFGPVKHLEEVEDRVLARVHPGLECRPCDRGQGRQRAL